MSDAERAELLNDYFSSVCTADNGAMPTVERLVPTGVEIESVEFMPGKVHDAIKKLKAGGASGPDGFLPLLFKKLLIVLQDHYHSSSLHSRQMVEYRASGHMQ